MKKKWISLVLLCVIGFSSLFGCDNKDASVVNKLNINGKDIVLKIGDATYTADELFADMLLTEEGAQTAYSKLLKIVTQTAMPVDKNMQDGLDLEFETWEKDVKEYSTESGIKYSDALKAKLTEAGVLTVEELKDVYAYKAQIKKLRTIYWKDNKSDYMDEFVETRMMYYVRHILVKVNQANVNQDIFYTSITEAIAEKLYKVYDMIVNDKSFSQVAYLLPSEDGGSASNGGAYTMNIDTSFVKEFKYGVIAFDAFSRGLEDQLFGTPGSLNTLYQNGFDSIPASYFVELNNVKGNSSTFYSSTGDDPFSSSYTIPRNIIFNNYFNTSGISLIEYDYGIPAGEEAPSNTCIVDFVKGETGKVSKRVLCDENDNPIFLTRGEHGIHFLVIEKSPFDLENTQEFFSLNPTPNDGYISYSELKETVKEQNRVIDELEEMAKTYAKRGTSDGAVAAAEEFLDYDMFLYYLEKDYDGKTIEIVNQTVRDIIYDYIAIHRSSKEEQALDKVASDWQSYTKKIEVSKSPFAKKQIPPLACLEYSTSNKNCHYTYQDGFTVVEVGD